MDSWRRSHSYGERYDDLSDCPGVAVQRVERTMDEHGAAVRLVHVVTTASSAAGCPQCGVVSTSVEQRRTTRPRGLPYGEEPLAVRWRKRQYRCRELACPRTAFTEFERPRFRLGRG